jgi:hypothetical protein
VITNLSKSLIINRTNPFSNLFSKSQHTNPITKDMAEDMAEDTRIY